MERQEQITNTIKELLKRMGVSVEEVSCMEQDNHTVFCVKSSDSHILIGSRGAHISALNHIIKRMVSKGEEELLKFYVDVNGYHDKLLREIKNKAQILAGRARAFKTHVEMEPMSSYERMIVHSMFQEAPDIETKSTGEGVNRRVVLIYKGE